MDEVRLTFWSITLRAIVVHTVTYSAVGLMAFVVLDYTTMFASPAMSSFLRQTDDPMVAAGPLFQPIRGALFGFVFYLLREVLFLRRRGWLIAWAMLAVVGIFSTFGPALGSVEGMIYTTVPLELQLPGLSELLLQSFLLSLILYHWVNHPRLKLLNWTLGILFVAVLFFAILGVRVMTSAA